MRQQRELIALTSVRGVAALWVAIYHFTIPINRDVICLSCYIPILEKSFLAVDLFFILSGYILTLVYQEKAKSFDRSSYFKFIRARLARIYPLHIFCLFAFLIFAALPVLLVDDVSFNPRNNPETFFYNVFLIHAWGTYNDFSWNNPSWSISTEFFAYLTFPILLTLLSKAKLLAKITFVLTVGLILLYPSLGGGIGDGKELFRCVMGFYLGVSGCLLFKTVDLPFAKTTTLQIVTFGFLIFSFNSELSDSIAVLMWLPLIYSLSGDSGLLSKILQHRYLHFLGTISYSIYLTHAIILMAYRDIRIYFFDAPINLGLFKEGLLLIGLVTITVAISHVTYAYIESRFRRLLTSR